MRILLSAISVCLGLALASCGGPTARHAAQEVPVDEAAAAAILSRYRAAHGLGPVSPDPRLARVAAAQARRNAEIGELSHEAGGSFAVRLASFGAADRGHAAENLAAGNSSLEATFAQWKASREHNKNLLLPNAKTFGLARADSPASRMKHYWALVLADR